MTTVTGRRSRLGRGLLARVAALSALALMGLLTAAAPASAHAERLGSQPEEGARLKKAPTSISIDFTEPPTGDARLEVLDGCGDDVVQAVEVANRNITSPLQDGEPGDWKVTSTVVSGIDGHQTKDSWSFEVAGQKDCSQGGGAGEGGGEAAGDEQDDGSSLPVIPIALGAAGVLAVALLLRMLTGRSDD